MTLLSLDNVKLGKKLGQGSYGVVYKGHFTSGCVAAVKLVSDCPEYGIESINEIDIMSRLKHLNVMPCLYSKGFKIGPNKECIEEKGIRDLNAYFAIVMPLAISDLMTYISTNHCTVDRKIDFVLDICKGLSFLHSNGVLHMDIKPENILILPNEDGTKRAVISDFGLSIYTQTKRKRHNKELVTISYRAPEVFTNANMYSDKVDVWSLGVSIIHIITGVKTLYRNPKQVWGETIVLFSDHSRVKNINYILRSVEHPRKHMIVDLLDKIMNPNPSVRYNIDEIIAHQIFDGKREDHSPAFSLTQTYSFKMPHLFWYMGLVSLFRSCINVNVSLETGVLALDIYHRMIHQMTDYSFKSIDMISITCLWVAYKTIEDGEIKTGDILNRKGCEFNSEELLTMERIIIEVLEGLIYRPNLYTKTKCVCEINNNISTFLDFSKYRKLDLNKIDKCPSKSCKIAAIPDSKIISFTYFAITCEIDFNDDSLPRKLYEKGLI